MPELDLTHVRVLECTYQMFTLLLHMESLLNNACQVLEGVNSDEGNCQSD